MSQKGREEPFYAASNVRTESFTDYHVPNTDIVLSWPYKTPSPEFMSKLGFYYEPTSRYKDRVRCISCNKLTSTWKNCKDPSAHHLKKSPRCWFSRMHKHIRDRANEAGHKWEDIEEFNDPLSAQAIEIRRKTFANNWPYDKIEGANPTSEKMSNAGFYYFPQEKDDDLVMCIYCGVSLEGWELDDDPLFEHKRRNTAQDCYYLHMLAKQEADQSGTPAKRPNSTELQSSELKKTRLSLGSEVQKEEIEAEPRLKPRRARQRAKPVVIDVSDSGEDESDSFRLTSNEDELLSDEDYNQPVVNKSIRSSRSYKSDKSTRANKSTTSTSSIKNNSKVLTSPKKSKILDSSFEDNGLFSNKNLKGAAIELLPKPVQDKQQHKPKKGRSKKLLDITNVSTSYIQDAKSKSEISMSLDSRSQTEQRPIKETSIPPSSPKLDNSKVSEIPNIQGEERQKKSPAENHENQKENNRDDDSDNDSIILVSNSKDSIGEVPEAESKRSSLVLKESSRTSRDAPLDHSQNSITVTMNANSNNFNSEEPAGELVKSRNESQPPNKSMLSQSRFLESPKITRSRSPFLDENYRGSDDISVHSLLKNPESILDPNDIPIEESTDHNIEAHFKPIDKTVLKQQAQDTRDDPIEETQESKSKAGMKSENDNGDDDEDRDEENTQIDEAKGEKTSSDESFHSADDDVTKDIVNPAWITTDTNKLFEPLEDLETAKTYIAEIKDLPYELHDDIDGRVSYFINEIPDTELDMTIGEWIKYSAKQGRAHFEQICQQMIDQFDNECDRALERLKSLNTI